MLFLQGGARLQFSMIPMNLMRRRPAAVRLHPHRLVEQVRRPGSGEVRRGAHVVWDGKATNYDRLPKQADLKLDPKAAYVYYASNETIQGVQFQSEPEAGDVPLVCDASSDFLEPAGRRREVRPDLRLCPEERRAGGRDGRHHPQGSAGAEPRDAARLPQLQDPRRGTARCGTRRRRLPIYMLMLVTKWLLTDIGGLDKMQAQNRTKAKLLYDVIDASGGFYAGHAQPDCRSLMNVTFRLPSDELTTKFVEGREGARPDRPEGPPLGRRHPGVDLQRDAGGRRRDAARVHG